MHLIYLCEDPGIPIDGTKGSSIHVRSMVKALAEEGATVSLFSPRIGDTSWAEGLPVHFYSLPADMIAAKAQDRQATAEKLNTRLLSLHSKEPFDGIYERLSLFASSGSRFCTKINIPHVIEVNAPLADEAARHRDLQHAEEARQIEKRVLRNANMLLPVSPALERWLHELGCDEKTITVLPNAVPDKWLTKNTSPPPQNNERLRLGFVGSLRPWHDIETLISAMTYLSSNQFELLIVGDGPLRKELEGWIDSYGVSDRVKWQGKLQHEEVIEAIDQMDYCLAPYSAEIDFYFCPIKIFEYGARGRPVIAADIPELGEQFPEDSMIYFSPGSPESLAETLQSIYEDQVNTSTRQAKTLRDYVAQHTWSNHARQILQMMSKAGGALV